MLKESHQAFAAGIKALDLFVVASIFVGTHHESGGGHLVSGQPPLESLSWLLATILVSVSISFHFCGVYARIRDRDSYSLFDSLTRGLLGALALTAIGIFFLKGDVSRVFLVAVFALSYPTLVFCRWGILRFLQSIRNRGYNSRNLLIVGNNGKARLFLDLVAVHPEWGYRIIGLLEKNKPAPGVAWALGLPVLGGIDDLEEILRAFPVDGVVFCTPHDWMVDIQPLLSVCEEMGVTIKIMADFFELPASQMVLEDIDGVPILRYQTTPARLVELMLKRLMDICVSGLLLFLMAPLFMAVAILIKVTMPGPVFFSQKRVGLNGRRFRMWKFRSMVVDAEARKAPLAKANEMAGPVFKISNDPRITQLGKLLRRTSIDELPQLWNVLVGDMSLVGPRPPLPKEVNQYERWQLRRLSMRPGLTCIWQVSGRNEVSFHEWMEMDLRYIDTWSFVNDLTILARTVPVVITGRGAR